jgi:hypothetical protein
MENIEEFKKELRNLLSKYDVSIGVELEGDTHNLSCDFCVFDKNDRIVTSLREGYSVVGERDF